MKKKYFGTDGIRGRANSSKMNAELALKIGIASAELFTRGEYLHNVLIGKDTRLSNYTIEPSLTAGFLSMGMNVYLTGPLPTPGVAALVSSMRCDVGVMISASHNEYVDNGIKIFGPDGMKLSDMQELKLEELIDKDNKNLVTSEKLGRAKRIDDAGGRYIEYLKSKIPFSLKLDGIKIVIDCANGAAYKVAPTILWELGATVYPINIDPDGTNVNKNSGSAHPEKIAQKVKSLKADIGIALDGDADRCTIVDENGNIVNGDLILAIISSDWKEKGKLSKKTVVGTVMSNSAFETYLKELGISFVRTAVGDRNIIAKMQEKKYVLGGEPSGHIILGQYSSTGDGILASLEILGIMKEKNKKLSELSNLFIPYPQILEDYKINNKYNGNILNIAKNKIDELKKEVHDKCRLIIRKSGTESKIRIMAEAKNINQAKKATAAALKILKSFQNEK